MNNFILCILPLCPGVLLGLMIGDKAAARSVAVSIIIAIVGFFLTSSFIPVVGQYTLKRGLSGKDLGKKGSITESKDIPEALGLVCGVVFLMMTIFTQLLFARDDMQHLVVFNSALFSICFMIFLGFTDDTLDLKWRYKLILPSIASLPLLTAYSGSTAVYIPKPFQNLFMIDDGLTTFGSLINIIATVDTEAHGKIIELGYLFLIFMGLLAVFCTNAINIYAGINGLECGQSYIIACSILTFKMYELSRGEIGDNQMFALLLIIPFIGTSLGLLRHNWFPASVFVGDTYCYFAGMTFAVVGIHGHFSKTLLLLFLPQIVNFIYSIPQLFKFIPCPRHRLPRIDPTTCLMHPSTFTCKPEEYRLFKVRSSDTEVPNCTVICLALRIFGPMTERSLCIFLLTLQTLSSILAFYIRYFVLDGN